MTIKKYFPLALVAFLCTTLTSCEVIGDIFKAGIWVGVIIVVLVIALIIWLVSKVF